MSTGEEASSWSAIEEESSKSSPTPFDPRSGYDSRTGIYQSLFNLTSKHEIPTSPDLDTASLVLSHFSHAHPLYDRKPAFIDSSTNQTLSYGELRSSVYALSSALFHGIGVRRGDVVFVVSPNSILYPTICLAVLKLGAILTTANPLNTESEYAKQVKDSGAKLAISAPEVLKKIAPTGIPLILTSPSSDGKFVSVQELIESCSENNPLEMMPKVKITQSDTAAILYSSGTTGMSKGVILTHANLISIMKILIWLADVSSSNDDVFLGFIPMFHIYGLMIFGMGLLCVGVTSVIMQRFELKNMLLAIQKYRVNNIPAVPPVILALVKHGSKSGYDLSSLRKVGSGAAPLSKELAGEFRKRFPWVDLRPGYGLTESCGAATFTAPDITGSARLGSSGKLLPTFCAKIVDTETGKPLAHGKAGELWLKSPVIMKGYLGNMEATEATLDSEGWLKTGDLAYVDEDGFVFVLERIKELIKHNGYQVI